MLTNKQIKFARQIVGGNQHIVDCYINAFMDGSTPEYTMENYTRAELTSRATQTKNTQAVKDYIEILKRNITSENAQGIVWTREKVGLMLMTDLKTYEDTHGKLVKLFNNYLKSAKEKYGNNIPPKEQQSLDRMFNMLTKNSQQLRNHAIELNRLYGLYDITAITPKVIIKPVYIESWENLPPDCDDVDED